MKFGSLFSGIGGFDLGFEQAGLSCEWQVEVDKDCNRVLEKRFPDVTRYADVKDVRSFKPVDVICGGFPCQDLSVAGKRKGLAGERSGLWFEFLRIAESNRPRWIVIENVPGLLSSDEYRDFAVILRGLVKCGYRIAWRVLDAQYLGLAQRRKRVFIVGSLGDGSSAEILFESKSVSWNPPTRREAEARVAATVTQRIDSNSRGWSPVNEADNLISCADVAPALTSRDRKSTREDIAEPAFVIANCFNGYTGGADDNDAQSNHLVQAVDTRNLRMQPHNISGTLAHKKSGGYSLNYQNPILAFSSKDHGADAGDISPTLRSQNFDKSHINGGGQVAIAFAENQRGEIRTSEISPQISCAGGKPGSGYPAVAFTERTRSEGRNLETQEELAYAVTNPGSGGRTHSRQVAGGFGVRRLTPRECERLQGFPDDWTLYDASGKEISDSARYRMLGNAVAVPVAKWIAKRIIKVGK